MNAINATVPTASKRRRPGSVDVIVAPWYAASRGARWVALCLFAVLTAGALAIGVITTDPKGEFAALFVYSSGVGCLWLTWLSTLLLLARDARRLRMPGVVRNMEAATCLYALALVIAPALIVAARGGNIVLAMQIPMLAIAACLAFLLLPRWLAIWLSFVPALYVGMHNAMHAPTPLDPRFQHWAWVALVLLVVVDVVRWRQLLVSEDDDDSGWRTAMLMQARRNVINCDWWSIDKNWAWRRSSKRKTAVDFRGIGPTNPGRTLAVALGGWYIPRTWRGRLDSLARVLVPLLLFIPLTWLMNIGHEDALRKVWRILGVNAGLWVGVFGTAMLALATLAALHRRWRSRADMALLALLPGLQGKRVANQLARTALTTPAVGFAVLWLCMLVPLGLLPQGAAATIMDATLATLFVVAVAALTLMTACKVWAGRSMGKLAQIVVAILLAAMLFGSLMLAMIAAQSVPGVWMQRAQWLTVLAWLALIAWATWQGIRAWQALRRRPHPFLANSP